MDLIGFVIFLIMAYGIGTYVEASHYQEIQKREKSIMHLPLVTSKNIENSEQIESAQLVYGSVVISLDYFKRILASLRNIFGGRIKSYESLLDRGRREAALRMREQAQSLGANIVLNTRFITSSVGQVANTQKANVGCFEVLAYGTAVKLKS